MMKSTRISTLDKRVRIERPLISRGRMGQENEPRAFELVRAVWAGIRTPTGREVENANQLQAQISLVVSMRHQPELEPTMRLVYGSRILKIVWINNVDEANRQLDVYCIESKDQT
ncbi:phage head closure protein [Singulisphaera sp. PoT]|uniref:phage head closure protein n=1 Tax=Singulisphaera sp. PoT TaxID=3411797 RepID=UPI003BF4CFE8